MQDISLGGNQPFFYCKNPNQPIFGQITIVCPMFLSRTDKIKEIIIDNSDNNILWYKDDEGIEYSIINALDTTIGMSKDYCAIIKNGQIDTLHDLRIRNVKISLDNLNEWGIKEKELSLPDAPNFDSLVQQVFSAQRILTLGVNKKSPVISIRGYMSNIHYDEDKEVEILIYHPYISGGMIPIVDHYLQQKGEQFPSAKWNINKYSISPEDVPYYTFETIGGNEGFQKLLSGLSIDQDEEISKVLTLIFYTEPYYNWSMAEEYVSFHFHYEFCKQLLDRIIEENSLGENEYEQAFLRIHHFEQLFAADELFPYASSIQGFNFLEKWIQMARRKRNKSTGHANIDDLYYPAGYSHLFVLYSVIALRIFSVIYLLHRILEFPEEKIRYITELPSFIIAREKLIYLCLLGYHIDTAEKAEKCGFTNTNNNIEGRQFSCSKCDFNVKYEYDSNRDLYKIVNPENDLTECYQIIRGDKRIRELITEHSSIHLS